MSAGQPNSPRNSLIPLSDRTRRLATRQTSPPAPATDPTPTVDLTQSDVAADTTDNHGNAATANAQRSTSPDVVIDETRSTPAPVPHVYFRTGTSRPIPPGVAIVRDVTRHDPDRRGVVIGHQIDIDTNGNEVHRDVALYPARVPQAPLELRYAFAEADYGDEFGLHWMHPDNDHVRGDEHTPVGIDEVVLNDYFQRLWIDGGLNLVYLYARQMILRPGRLVGGWRLAIWYHDMGIGLRIRLADVLASQRRARGVAAQAPGV